jgi:hypothetical protein
MSPIIHYLRGCVIKLRSIIRVRCVSLRRGIIAERAAREGGSARSAYLEQRALVSEEPSAGRNHRPILKCRRETKTAEALQKLVTNGGPKLYPFGK